MTEEIEDAAWKEIVKDIKNQKPKTINESLEDMRKMVEKGKFTAEQRVLCHPSQAYLFNVCYKCKGQLEITNEVYEPWALCLKCKEKEND